MPKFFDPELDLEHPTREEASWQKTTLLEILKIKNNYDAGNVTKENALSRLEALLSGVEELGPGSPNDR